MRSGSGVYAPTYTHSSCSTLASRLYKSMHCSCVSRPNWGKTLNNMFGSPYTTRSEAKPRFCEWLTDTVGIVFLIIVFALLFFSFFFLSSVSSSALSILCDFDASVTAWIIQMAFAIFAFFRRSGKTGDGLLEMLYTHKCMHLPAQRWPSKHLQSLQDGEIHILIIKTVSAQISIFFTRPPPPSLCWHFHVNISENSISNIFIFFIVASSAAVTVEPTYTLQWSTQFDFFLLVVQRHAEHTSMKIKTYIVDANALTSTTERISLRLFIVNSVAFENARWTGSVLETRSKKVESILSRI